MWFWYVSYFSVFAAPLSVHKMSPTPGAASRYPLIYWPITGLNSGFIEGWHAQRIYVLAKHAGSRERRWCHMPETSSSAPRPGNQRRHRHRGYHLGYCQPYHLGNLLDAWDSYPSWCLESEASLRFAIVDIYFTALRDASLFVSIEKRQLLLYKDTQSCTCKLASFHNLRYW